MNSTPLPSVSLLTLAYFNLDSHYDSEQHCEQHCEPHCERHCERHSEADCETVVTAHNRRQHWHHGHHFFTIKTQICQPGPKNPKTQF